LRSFIREARVHGGVTGFGSSGAYTGAHFDGKGNVHVMPSTRPRGGLHRRQDPTFFLYILRTDDTTHAAQAVAILIAIKTKTNTAMRVLTRAPSRRVDSEKKGEPTQKSAIRVFSKTGMAFLYLRPVSGLNVACSVLYNRTKISPPGPTRYQTP
jgi:hypothetical protein